MKSLLLMSFMVVWYYWGSNPIASSHNSLAEVCDNALDDDNDGLIDLNDPDCECPVANPVSLIPNPSFEDQTCCPDNRSQLYCATGWIQASEATTDYLHTCGWMGWDDLPPPLPFPDGNGCAGFRNGRSGSANGQGPLPNWKEYAGACLTSPLKAGVAYRFEFYIGFTYPTNSPPTNIVFYGSPTCVNLPFGIGNAAFGCPTNGPGWVALGSVPIYGANEWILKKITVTPLQDMYAIAIGPDCVELTSGVNTYYFFDNLVLANQAEFGFNISAAGHPCSGSITLSIPYLDTLNYQWYLNGVALVGETEAELREVYAQGKYQVRLIGPNSCRITTFYDHKIPVFSSSGLIVICYRDTYFFNQKNIGTTGTFWDTLKTANNCDSIIRLDLEVSGEITDTVFAKIFKGESWEIGPRKFSTPGEYSTVLISSTGCDSVVFLKLDFYKVYIPTAFSPNGDGINDIFTIYSGEDIKEVLALKVFDRWGSLVFETPDLNPADFKTGWDGKRKGKAEAPGLYVYKAVIVFQDGKERELTGEVVLVK